MGATPDGLAPRGAALWSSLGRDLNTASGAIALEACRIADRLDELASVIEGKGVLNLMSFRLALDLEDEVGDRHVTVKVEFSNVLAEARQQASALAGLLSKLGLEKASAPASGGNPLATVLQIVGSQPSGRSS